jgi:hypothetical protein
VHELGADLVVDASGRAVPTHSTASARRSRSRLRSASMSDTRAPSSSRPMHQGTGWACSISECRRAKGAGP